MLSKIVAGAAPYLPDVITAIFGALAAWTIRWLNAHTRVADSANAQAVLTRLQQVTEAVVRETSQTMVESLKTAAVDNKLTGSEAQTAVTLAMAKIKDNIGGDKGAANVQEVLGVPDINAFIRTQIEAAVHKIAAPAVAQTAATSAASSATVATVAAGVAVAAASDSSAR